MSIVHVLNGDALKERWPETILGELIVARECLIDGNVQGENLAEFFANRAKVIAKYPGCTEQGYFEGTVPEFERLKNLPDNSQIYCWFEHDLFCQSNFWFVLSIIYENTVNCDVYFVQPSLGNEYSFANMGQDELSEQHKKAQIISSVELAIFQQMWRAYQARSAETLKLLAAQLHTSYPFLPATVEAEIARYPDEKGFSKPERMLLSIMKELNTEEFAPIFRKFYYQSQIYSFGDLQVKRMLDALLMKLKAER